MDKTLSLVEEQIVNLHFQIITAASTDTREGGQFRSNILRRESPSVRNLAKTLFQVCFEVPDNDTQEARFAFKIS